MDELSKIRRIVDKKAPDAKVESLGSGRHPRSKWTAASRNFYTAAQLSGVVLTSSMALKVALL